MRTKATRAQEVGKLTERAVAGERTLSAENGQWLLSRNALVSCRRICQCESIQGREPGMLFEPSAWLRARLLILGPVGRVPVVEARLGLSEARSLITWPARAFAFNVDSCGTLSRLRGESAPQVGQSHGSAFRLIVWVFSFLPLASQVFWFIFFCVGFGAF